MERFNHWLSKHAPSRRSDDRPAPPFLSSPRKRALTLLPPGDEAKPQQKHFFQDQSSFLAKLSRDVRLMIFEEIFGNRSIHVVYEYSKSKKKKADIWNIVCKNPLFVGDADCCRVHEGVLRELPSPPPIFAKINPSILLCCRQTYSEGIDVLYSNEFRFHDTYTLRIFPSLVLPQRLARVTAVVFSWPLPPETQPHVSVHKMEEYAATWEFFASHYRCLRKLRVSLDAPGLSIRGEASKEDFQRAWLEPLEKLAQSKLELFEIYAPKSFYFYFKGVTNRKLYRLIETPHQGLVYG